MTSIFKRKGRKGYAVQYQDPASLRWKQRQFHTKVDAQHYADRVRSHRLEASGLEMDVRFDYHAERWLASTETAVRPGTASGYRSITRRHLVPAFGETYLRDLTPKMVRDLIVSLRSSLSKKSVANIRATLHACLQAAVEERVLKTNPAGVLGRSKLTRLATTAGEARGKVKAMTAEQARRFLRFAPAVAPRHAKLFRVMLATGLRPGEAIGLQPDDVDYSRGILRLRRAVTPQNHVMPCKTNAAGEWETVDLPQALAAELASWREEMEAEGVRSRWLFPARGGGFLDRKGTADAFARVLREAKLPDHFTPHSLRHTYATLQLTAGESVYYVSRQLRHADIRITVRTYGSWLPAGNAAVADRHFERLFVSADCQQDETIQGESGELPGPKPRLNR